MAFTFVCPRCGNEGPAVCPRCAAESESWASKPRPCPKCGTIFTSAGDVGQCPKCRNRFLATDPTGAVAQAVMAAAMRDDSERLPVPEAQALVDALGGRKRKLRGADATVDALTDVVLDSGAGLVVDWRGEADEAVKELAKRAKKLGVKVTGKWDEDRCGGRVTVSSDGRTRTVSVRYVPNEEGSDFGQVVTAIQGASNGKLAILGLRGLDGKESDTYAYIVVSPEKVEELRRASRKVFSLLFRDPGT